MALVKTTVMIDKDDRKFFDENCISLSKFIRSRMKQFRMKQNENALPVESRSIFNHVTNNDDCND